MKNTKSYMKYLKSKWRESMMKKRVTLLLGCVLFMCVISIIIVCSVKRKSDKLYMLAAGSFLLIASIIIIITLF